ncbi:MAG: hypothetical protein R2713_17485 [Ilumatobacteraceae bacterium]
MQSPSVRLIVERERERIAFVTADYWDVDLLTATSPAFTATLVALDGTKVATGKDHQRRPTEAAASWLVDEPRAQAWPTPSRQRRSPCDRWRRKPGEHASRRS